MKKVLVMCIALVLSVSAVIGGTVAYLTDTDSAVNVAVVGNVDIVQHEKQRAEGVEHAGTLKDGDLVNYVQAQKLYPAYPVNNAATDYSAEATDLLYWGSYVTAEGAGNGLWNDEKLKGAMDKMVFVENTGSSDCYYRTWIAFESPEEDMYSAGADKQFMMNVNGHDLFDWETVGYDTIDGTQYLIMCATYQEKLAPKEISRPSLLQVVMTHNATNDTVKALGDTYEILTFTQAVQTNNMPDAATALKTAFKQTKEENGTINHPWQDGVDMPVIAYDIADLKAVARNGGECILGADLHITDKSDFFYGSYITAIYNDMTLDLNGHKIVVDVEMETVPKAPVLFYVYSEGASLTIVGDGDVIAKHDAFIVFPRSVSDGAYIYGGNYYNNDDTSGTKNDINAIGYAQGGKIHVYGGTFTFKNVGDHHCGGFNVHDSSQSEIVLYEGVLLSNSDYYLGWDANKIHLEEGCTLQEVEIDGVTWYKVVKA